MEHLNQQVIQNLGEMKGTQQAILSGLDRVLNRLDKLDDRITNVEAEHTKFKDEVKADIQDIKITQGKYGLVITLIATGISLGFSKLLDIFAGGQ